MEATTPPPTKTKMTTAQLKIRAFDSAYQVPYPIMMEAIAALRETGRYEVKAPTYHRAPSAEVVAEKLAFELYELGVEARAEGNLVRR